MREHQRKAMDSRSMLACANLLKKQMALITGASSVSQTISALPLPGWPRTNEIMSTAPSSSLTEV
jgi:hypothetical protein